MNFSEIIGQKKIIRMLTKAIESGNVGHGYIFSGPEGIGKSTVAEIFVRALLCENQYNGVVPCEQCLSCQMLLEGSHPDYTHIAGNDGSIGVEEIRKKLQTEVLIKPSHSRRKVYLITEADKMTVQAQNCILKTLEEPPDYCTIILTTENYDVLLDTVRSRSSHLAFVPCSEGEIFEALKTRDFGCEMPLEIVAALSMGIPGRAFKIAEDKAFMELRDKTTTMIKEITNKKVSAAFGYMNYINSCKDTHEELFSIMTLFYRDILVYKEAGDENLLINKDKKDIIVACAHKTDNEQALKKIDIIEDTRRMLRHNVNYGLAAEAMLIKLGEG